MNEGAEPFNPSKARAPQARLRVYIARNTCISGETSNASDLRQTERSVDAN
jgi:hypothetical protein